MKNDEKTNLPEENSWAAYDALRDATSAKTGFREAVRAYGKSAASLRKSALAFGKAEAACNNKATKKNEKSLTHAKNNYLQCVKTYNKLATEANEQFDKACAAYELAINALISKGKRSANKVAAELDRFVGEAKVRIEKASRAIADLDFSEKR